MVHSVRRPFDRRKHPCDLEIRLLKTDLHNYHLRVYRVPGTTKNISQHETALWIPKSHLIPELGTDLVPTLPNLYCNNFSVWKINLQPSLFYPKLYLGMATNQFQPRGLKATDLRVQPVVFADNSTRSERVCEFVLYDFQSNEVRALGVEEPTLQTNLL